MTGFTSRRPDRKTRFGGAMGAPNPLSLGDAGGEGAGFITNTVAARLRRFREKAPGTWVWGMGVWGMGGGRFREKAAGTCARGGMGEGGRC